MRLSIYSAIVGLGSTAYAASISQKCFGTVCYSMNIPDTTSSSGSGDVYYQITGPTSVSWIGMGTGSQMKGSTMFVIYTSSSGTNITLSPRSSIGEVQPTFDSTVQATLMDGSGVSGGMMTANIKCSSCNPKTSSFIYAFLSGPAVNSDSQTEDLQQHGMQDMGGLALSVTSATGGSDSNPFVASSSSGSSASSSTGSTGSSASSGVSGSSGSSGSTTVVSGPACATSSGTQAASTSASASGPYVYSSPVGGAGFGPFSGSMFRRAAVVTNDGCNENGNSGSTSSSGSNIGATGSSNKRLSRTDMMRMAHGICAGLAFAVLYPLGAIVLRLFSFPGLIWVHAGIQIVTNILFIVGFVLGINLANEIGVPLSNYHPVIGIVLLCMVIIQPILGHMHHRSYKKVGTRTAWSYGHLIVGRLLITLGIINGGLGFMLANNTTMGQTVYAIVAAIIYAVYLLSVIIGERKRMQSQAMPPKYEGSPMSMSPRIDYFGNDGTIRRDIHMERFPPPMPGNHRGDGYTRQQSWPRQ